MWVGANSGIAIAQYLIVNLMVGFSEGISVFVVFSEFQFFNDDVMSYHVPVFYFSIPQGLTPYPISWSYKICGWVEGEWCLWVWVMGWAMVENSICV